MLAVFRLKTSHATQKLWVVVCCTLRITSYLYLGRKQPKEKIGRKSAYLFRNFSSLLSVDDGIALNMWFLAPFSTRAVLDVMLL